MIIFAKICKSNNYKGFVLLFVHPAYNYITNSGKQAIIEAIEDRFIQNLWSELSQLTFSTEGKGINTHIAAWCEMHGISLDYVETVRQKYFRTRKAYTVKGIDLRNFSRKKTGQE